MTELAFKYNYALHQIRRILKNHPAYTGNQEKFVPPVPPTTVPSEGVVKIKRSRATKAQVAERDATIHKLQSEIRALKAEQKKSLLDRVIGWFN